MNRKAWIPETKLAPPQSVVKILSRPQLVSSVTKALNVCRLTMLSAPAGSGKTTLAVQAIKKLGHTPVAWLRLGEDENELPAFLYALIFAWKQILPEMFDNAMNLLQNFSDKMSHFKPVLTTLINELVASRYSKLILVLDDYHVIRNKVIHDAVTYLLEHMPVTLHILMTTRIRPALNLTRLHLQNQLTEIRLDDMKFDAQEIQTYFKELWNIDLTPSEAQFIYQRTGGWAASLHLLALSFQRKSRLKEKRLLIDKLASSNELIYRLLAEEVLLQQPEELQTFLLQTSILSELTPYNCCVVTGHSAAAELLEEAFRRDLFLVAMENQAAYRYHDLFAEFLQHRLAVQYPELLPDLHVRAAQASADAAQKIRHYLAAHHWDAAADVLEQEGESLLTHGHIRLVQHWISLLPETMIKQRPHLQYFLGVCALQTGDLSTADDHLQQALWAFRSEHNEVAEGQTLLQLANLASALHNNQQTFSYLQQALQKPLKTHQKVQAHITSVWMHVYAGRLKTEGHKDLMQALRITKLSRDSISFNILGHQLRGPLLFSKLGVAPLEQYCREILDRFDETATPANLGALCLLNVILLMKGKLEQARKMRHQAMKMNQQLGYLLYISIALDLTELWDHLFRSDFQRFETYWHHRLPFYEQTEGARQWLISFLFMQGLHFYLRGNVERVGQILERMEGEFLEQDLPENCVTKYTLQGILLLHRQQWNEAQSVLTQAIDFLNHAPFALLFANPYIWLAHLYLLHDEESSARQIMEDLFSCFHMQEMGGLLLREGAIVGPLLQLMEGHTAASQILRLWGQFHHRRLLPIPQSPEALTSREMEVLRLLAEGARNQEIAETLFITVRTVKAHVSKILAKMGVQSRTQAVTTAHQMKIL